MIVGHALEGQSTIHLLNCIFVLGDLRHNNDSDGQLQIHILFPLYVCRVG